MLNFDDPGRHLHWIYGEVKKAEEAAEKVYIIGHIPPGGASCFGKPSARSRCFGGGRPAVS